MSHYLVLSHAEVQNANTVSGFTWGFPAITQFLGFAHALGLKCDKTFKENYTFNAIGCAVVANSVVQKTFWNKGNYEFLQTKRTPTFAKDKNSSPPIVEEGKLNMTVSLIIELEGKLPVTSEAIKAFEEDIKQLCCSMRIAGGTVLDIKQVKLLSRPTSEEQNKKLHKKIKSLIMPGFVLKDRSQYLANHYEQLLADDPNSEKLDAWLNFSALKQQAQLIEGVAANEAEWSYVPKPEKGYLVPIMIGYKAISELYQAGEVANVRDSTVPTRFVEAVHSVGEWIGAHRIESIDNFIWRYEYQNDAWYLCKQKQTNQRLDISLQDSEELTDSEEITLNDALDLILN